MCQLCKELDFTVIPAIDGPVRSAIPALNATFEAECGKKIKVFSARVAGFLSRASPSIEAIIARTLYSIDPAKLAALGDNHIALMYGQIGGILVRRATGRELTSDEIAQITIAPMTHNSDFDKYVDALANPKAKFPEGVVRVILNLYHRSRINPCAEVVAVYKDEFARFYAR